jgi:hypothetical protein
MNTLHCGGMSEHRRWGLRQSAAAVAVAAGIAVTGGAAIYAATAGTSHPFGASHQTPGQPGGMQRANVRPGQSEIAPLSLHGEFVVADDTGGYRTELTQTGTVTATAPTSITVRSEDGFSQTYVIPTTTPNASAPFAVDDQVVVHATRNGQTATVTDIGNALPGLSGAGSAPAHRN